MPEPTKPKPDSDLPPATGAGPMPGRRRLLQGGLAGAPVLMTLASRPVLAQVAGGTCTTPSGFVSANASTAGRGVTCLGRGPGFWKQANSTTNKWPSPYQNLLPAPNTVFNTVFTPPYAPYDTGGTGPGGKKTLLDVLLLTGGPPDAVARAIVAAYMDVVAGLTPVLTTQLVKDIWSEYSQTGSFSPTSGAHWSADEILAYLETTFTV
jgi:hypothetical protein